MEICIACVGLSDLINNVNGVATNQWNGEADKIIKGLLLLVAYLLIVGSLIIFVMGAQRRNRMNRAWVGASWVGWVLNFIWLGALLDIEEPTSKKPTSNKSPVSPVLNPLFVSLHVSYCWVLYYILHQRL